MWLDRSIDVCKIEMNGCKVGKKVCDMKRTKAVNVSALTGTEAPVIENSASLVLDGVWMLRNGNGKYRAEALVPGDNYSALEKAGVLPDPYWRCNENAVQWVADEDWIYSRTFVPGANILEAKSVVLSFESIDTVGEVFLNGVSLGKVNNEFRRWRFEVKNLLKADENLLEVRLRSVTGAMADDVAAHPHPDVLSWGCGKYAQIARLRKTQCSEGWDWGIALPVSGIYGKTELFSADTAYLQYLWNEQNFFDDGSAEITLVAELMPTEIAKAGDPVSVDFEFNGQHRTVEAEVPRNCGSFDVSAVFKVAKPVLWWPNGLGKQKLYSSSATVEGRTISRKVGLRTVELVREKDGEGETFYFKVNGKRIFAKGVNWIPCEAHPSRRTPDRIEHLLDLCSEANMNMIRVWGGGSYEQECFYEKCDALGLLVWQDMMFACGVYPDWLEFTDNVRAELNHQIRRLRSHPSIALWCGDNENLSCVYVTRSHYALIDRLIRTEAEVIERIDSSRPWWPTSPCSGDRVYENNFDHDKGDQHLWAVPGADHTYWGYLGMKCRFVSEYGFGSLPSMKQLKTFTEPEDRYLDSEVVNLHLKKTGAHDQMIRNVCTHIREPKSFSEAIELSREWQAMAARDVTSKWMRDQPYCGGVLFWQLNEWWPGTSWAIVEYDGTPKPVYYALKEVFSK